MTAEQIFAPGLLPTPEQPLSVEVTTHNRQVILHLSQPREFVAFSKTEPVIVGARMLAQAIEADPANARHVIDIALALVDAAYDANGDLKPAGGAVKHELIERHRRTLSRRLEIVLNSRRETKKVTNGQLSKELVEVMLKEVFA
jgi:hypothetical protein